MIWKLSEYFQIFSFGFGMKNGEDMFVIVNNGRDFFFIPLLLTHYFIRIILCTNDEAQIW